MIPIGKAEGGATLNAPVEHLNACHRRIEERLDTLERVIPHLANRTAEAMAAIHAAFRFFDASGTHHTADEEESFFPRMAAGLSPGETEFLQALHEEHQRAERLYSDLKGLVAGMSSPPSGDDVGRYSELARELCGLYRAHIRLEDERFPSIARRVLSSADLEAISGEMKQRRGIEWPSPGNSARPSLEEF